MKKLFSLHLIFFLFVSCSNEKKDKKSLATFTALSNFFSDTTDKSSSKKTTLPPITKLNIKDPLYKDQWHLKNEVYRSASLEDGSQTKIDINVEPVWEKGYLGEGVKIGVLDTYIQYDHPDLRDNLPAQNYFNPYPNDPFCQGDDGDTHGTQVAGIIAARDNNIGTRGVAPRATLYGYTVMRSHLASAPLDKKHHLREMLKAFRRSEHRDIAVYNGSLGDGGTERGYMTNATEEAVLKAFDQITQNGFQGKGSSLVFAAGNEASMVGSSANNQFLNHYAVIAVNSILGDGSIIEGEAFPVAGVSGEIGPNIWLVAPTADSWNHRLMTTDLMGDCGSPGDWNATFAATSGATPSVTGVVALLREANPNLTWRDVKLILSESAKKIAPADPTKSGIWQNTGIMHSDHSKTQKYHRVMGFGLVDAGAALRLAKNWSLLPTMKTETFEQRTSVNTESLDVLHSSSLNVQNSQIGFVESVQVDLEIERTLELNLFKWTLYLVSPDGKVVKIYGALNRDYEAMLPDDGLSKFSFLLNSFLGNNTINGNWILKLQLKTDVANKGKIKTIKNWKLTVRGH